MGTTSFTVTEYPSTVSTTGTWTNPETIYSNDGSFASTTGTLGAVVELITSNFGFNIPTYATITSIIVQTRHASTSGTDGHAKYYISLCHNGVSKKTGTLTDMRSTATIASLSLNAEEIASVSIAELNSNLMQVVIGVEKLSGTETYRFDYASIIVEYTVLSETVLVNGHTLIDTDWVNPHNVYASDNIAMTWNSPAAAASQELWLNIPNMGIPTDATIQSAYAVVKVKHNLNSRKGRYYTDLYDSSKLIQAENKDITATATMFTSYDMDNYTALPTVAQCNSGNLRIKFKISQTTASSVIYSVDCVSLIVIYSMPASGNIYVNIGGTWKLGMAYVNVGGVWKQAVVSANMGGVWKS